MINNVYIHIPFCRQKCRYCSFVSFTALEKRTVYTEALIREIRHFYKDEKIRTLYFGGGTPSLLDTNSFIKILALFNFDINTEITVEINPETVNKKYLLNLKKAGINRLSFGCQTFDKKILRFIGRRHTPEQLTECVKTAQDIGFRNISLDFIYGLPRQTQESFEDDLIKAAALNVQHISLYGLKIEEGCFFYLHRPEFLPDEDIQADYYLAAIKILKEVGFKHYEISNFAVDGFQSRHNLNYWNNNSYYGFGVSAHGYTGNVRYSNKITLNDYIKNPCEHEFEHHLTDQEKLEEEIFLGFRKTEGINTEKINRKFSIDFDKDYNNILDKYLYSGHMVKTSAGYKLTNTGLLVSNVLLAEFLQ